MEKTHKVSTDIIENIPVLYVEGDITSEADSDIMKHYTDLKETHSPYHLVINFDKTKYINSAGIATLINIIQDLGDIGGKISFVGLSNHFQKVMDIVGISDFVDIFVSNEEAFKNIKKEKK